MTALFNYAVKYYDLPNNPCKKAGSIGKKQADEMDFWTQAEFSQFVDSIMNKQQSYMAFMTFFWTGMRLGELLALAVGDIDFDKRTMSITKSDQRINSKDVITEPKTPKGKRVVTIPQFDLQDYISGIYKPKKKDRLFPITKYFLEHEMQRGIKGSGVKRIRLHDLRHHPAKLKLKIILISTSSLEKPILTNLCLFYLGDNINKISITYHYSCFQVFSHLGNLIGIASAFWQRYLILQVFHFARYHV